MHLSENFFPAATLSNPHQSALTTAAWDQLFVIHKLNYQGITFPKEIRTLVRIVLHTFACH